MRILGIILPLFIAIFTGSFGRFLGFYGTRLIIFIGMLITIIINLYNLNLNFLMDSFFIQYSIFLSVNLIAIPWSFQIDSLVVTMTTMITIISSLVQLYSCVYMEEDPHQIRFLTYLMLFTFFMLFFVSSGNLIQLFVGWEGVGLCSYLLINFWFGRIQANKSAIKAMLINKIGDAGLLISFTVIFFLLKDVNFSTLFSSELIFSLNKILKEIELTPLLEFGVYQFNDTDHKDEMYWYSIIYSQINLFLKETFSYTTHFDIFYSAWKILFNSWTLDILNILIFCGIFLGVMAKSAQLGLHTWLPDAMEGPTPLSALIHAATMVTAGIFAFIRVSPILDQYKNLFNIVIIVGATTAIYSAITALNQHDSKKIIAFSTCSQLGYMVIAAGSCHYNLSFFHLINHAFFKALLFLTAGSIIHILLDDQDIRQIGSLQSFAPITTVCGAIGTIAIIGFPFLSGFYSKDIIIEATYLSTVITEATNLNISNNFSFYMATITAILTTFYSFRLVYLVYFNNMRSAKIQVSLYHESPFLLTAALMCLSIGSVITGYFFRDYFIGSGNNIFNNSMAIEINYFVLHNFEYLPVFLKLIPVIFMVMTIITITNMYTHYLDVLWAIKILYPKTFLLVLTNFNFNLLQTKIATLVLKQGYALFFYNLDKGLLELFGPLTLLKLLKQMTTYLLNYQLKSLYDYSLNLSLTVVILMSLIYTYKSFTTKSTWYCSINQEQTNAEVLPIDIVINFCFGIAIVSSIFCFWIQHNKPVLSLGFFFLTILPNVIILFLLKVEYLALIFLIVYAGAIVILFLFVLIMCEPNNVEIKIDVIPEKNHNSFILLMVCVGIFFYFVFTSKLYIYSNWYEQLNQTELSNLYSNDFIFYTKITYDITFFGEYLLNYSAVFLIFAGIILFIAMLGSILIVSL